MRFRNAMLRVILVEDEQITRQGIKTLIPWEKLHCRLIGEASDGHEAIELINKLGADIVITDIKMPRMNGLELAEKLAITHPKCRVIILTGYAEFEYARQAIKSRVVDFLLKPVGEEELIEILKSTVSHIEEEVQSQEKITKNINEVKCKIFEDIMYGRIDLKKLYKKIEELRLNLSEDREYQVLIVFPRTTLAGERNKNPPLISISPPPGSIRISIHLDSSSGEAILLTNEYSAQNQTDLQVLKPQRSEFLCELNNLKSNRVIVTIGTKHKGLHGLLVSAEEAKETYRWHSWEESKHLIHYSNIETLKERFCKKLGYYITPEEAEKRIAKMLKNLQFNDNDIRNIVRGLLHYHLSKKVSESEKEKFQTEDQQREYLEYCEKFYYQITGKLEERGIYIETPTKIQLNYSRSNQLLSWVNLLKEVESLFLNLGKNIRECMEKNYSPITLQTIYYIKTHFKEEISLKQISKITGTSESHISRVFKKDTGINLISWINRYRVEYSKELLAIPQLKLYDIADLSGFSDYKYYVRQFKRYVGISPLEYRKNILS